MHGIAARCREEDMTVKRDFKRRVRQRQARTGESYVTARRHLLASRAAAAGTPPDQAEPPADADSPGDATPADAAPSDAARSSAAPPDAAPANPAAGPAGRISVVELVDVTDDAKRFGLMCRVLMFPALIERIEPARVLGRLRDLLIATIGDPGTAVLGGLVLTGQKPPPRRPAMQNFDGLRRFLQRARAGLGGVFDDGSALAFHIAEGGGMIPILCTLSAQDTAIELSVIDDLVPPHWESVSKLLEPLSTLAAISHVRATRVATTRTPAMAAVAARHAMPTPTLFVIHDQRRYPITQDEFVIGRSRPTADLAIEDGMISRRHAAVIRRSGVYYLKDLGSELGIVYKGMHIDNKRIDEGDVFQLGDHELRFTFETDG
jgi:hypothetical protein